MSRRVAIGIVMAVLTVLPLSATSMKELLIAAPDSLFPYLDKAKRSELVDLWEIKARAGVTAENDAPAGVTVETKNKLDGTSRLDTLTADFMQLTLNKQTQMQAKLIQKNGDSLICVVKTISLPEGDSEVAFYDFNWNLKRRVAFDWHNHVVKPDTMSEEVFNEKMKAVEIAFVKASIHADDDWVELNVEAPLIPKNIKPELNAILQRNVKLRLADVK